MKKAGKSFDERFKREITHHDYEEQVISDVKGDFFHISKAILEEFKPIDAREGATEKEIEDFHKKSGFVFNDQYFVRNVQSTLGWALKFIMGIFLFSFLYLLWGGGLMIPFTTSL